MLTQVTSNEATTKPMTNFGKRHQISANVLYYWRKVYRELLDADLADIASKTDVADLELQVRNLERLLGQRTLEVAMLREKLGLPQRDELDE